MNYQQAIDYLFFQLPMFSRIGQAAYKTDITNTVKLCEALNNPHLKFKSVHIAGTNGKGSVSHMLAAILQTCGYKVGLYTSPHLKDFRERIKINGKLCEEQFVIDFVQRMQAVIETVKPSFFEITAVMAFEYFAQQKVDIAVIETGLGGRLDSTNIILPQLSVITNVSFDHMNILGNTLTKIAAEKAGIIKPFTPVVIGESATETDTVFKQTALEKQAPVSFAQQHYAVDFWQHVDSFLEVTVNNLHLNEKTVYRLDLTGIYQTKNLLTVLEAVFQLQQLHWAISESFVNKALTQVKKITGLHGRWELVHRQPNIILDVAHNEAGIKQVVQQIELLTYRQLHIVIGFVKDKEVHTLLSLLPKTAVYYFTKASIPRALDEKKLQAMAQENGLKGESYAHVNEAVLAAITFAEPNDTILICGSVFVVGEAYAELLA